VRNEAAREQCRIKDRRHVDRRSIAGFGAQEEEPRERPQPVGNSVREHVVRQGAADTTLPASESPPRSERKRRLMERARLRHAQAAIWHV
jgi:hypothetical protein